MVDRERGQAVHLVTTRQASRAASMSITYGFHDSPVGESLVATTDQGVCFLGFTAPASQRALLDELRETWPGVPLSENPAVTGPMAVRAFDTFAPPPVHVQGSDFQIQVWRALLRVPLGTTISYGQLARRVGRPGAARAVGAAVGRNPVSVVIPCHRVVLSTGALHRYRWGADRKRALLAREAAH